MNSEQWEELPEGWRWATIGGVCDTTSGGTPSRQKQEYFGGSIPWVKSGELEDTIIEATEETITKSGLANSSAKVFPTGTPLVALYGATVGRTGLLGIDAATNQAVCALFSDKSVLNTNYLLKYLQSQRADLIKVSTGGAQPNISQKIIREWPIPIPPLPEQHRLVAKIERLFAESRTAREALEGVPALLKRFRQAVLAKAFRGELTERDPNDEPASVLLERIRAERRRKWEEHTGSSAVALRTPGGSATAARTRKGKNAKYVEPEPPDTSELPEVPERWCWASIGDVIDLLQYGTSVKADANAESGVPVLRMGNIQEGQLDFGNLKYIDPIKDDIPKYRLQKDDILINRTNSPELVGKAAIFDNGAAYVFASYLIRLRVSPELILPRYLLLVINSEIGRRHVVKVKHQVAGQANINSQNIREMPIPLAPLADQRRIVAKIESLFAQAEAIEQAVVAAQRRAEKVEQAVLARAFRGEL